MLKLGKPSHVTFARANLNALRHAQEALEIVESDEAADKRFNDALTKLPEQTEQLTATVKKKDWKPLIATAEQRSERIAEKLEALNARSAAKKQKELEEQEKQ